jgi:hypothetical protein
MSSCKSLEEKSRIEIETNKAVMSEHNKHSFPGTNPERKQQSLNIIVKRYREHKENF